MKQWQKVKHGIREVHDSNQTNAHWKKKKVNVWHVCSVPLHLYQPQQCNNENMTSVTASLYPCSTSLNHLLMAVISDITSATFRVNFLVPSKREPYKRQAMAHFLIKSLRIPTRGTGSKLQLQGRIFIPGTLSGAGSTSTMSTLIQSWIPGSQI